MSGGWKKAIGVLCKEQLVIILLFFGAGGQIFISGIRNLSAFGVEQELLLDISTSTTFISSEPPICKESAAGFTGELARQTADFSSISLDLWIRFLKWVLLFLAVDFLALLPQDGPIIWGDCLQKLEAKGNWSEVLTEIFNEGSEFWKWIWKVSNRIARNRILVGLPYEHTNFFD